MKKRILNIFLVLILISISYFAMVETKVKASDEDFTSYDEVDPESNIDFTSSNVTINLLNRNATSYLYKNMGENYFSGNFTFYQTLVLTDGNGASGFWNSWALANSINDWQTIDDSNGSALSVICSDGLVAGKGIISISECDSGAIYSGDNPYTCNYNSTYYLKVVRNESASAYGTLFLYIYSDAARENLLNTDTLVLHTDKKDYQYVYAVQSRNTGEASVWGSGSVTNFSWISGLGESGYPVVTTFPANEVVTGAWLQGYATTTQGSIEYAGFNWGTSNTSMPNGITATLTSPNYFEAIIPSANLTIGQTYFFKAYAHNAYGTGDGNTRSFTWTNTGAVIVETGFVGYTLAASGNFSAHFLVSVVPIGSADEINGYLSASYGNLTTTSVKLTSTYEGSGHYMFYTGNFTDPSSAEGRRDILLPDVTYYYQGSAIIDEVEYFGEIKSFTPSTTFIRPQDKPEVEIIRVRDVSQNYTLADGSQAHYYVEATAKVYTTNTTASINAWGFQFALSQTQNALIPPIYKFPTSSLMSDDYIYTQVFTLDAAAEDWYNGEKLYWQAYISTSQHGEIYSVVVPFEFNYQILPPNIIPTPTTGFSISEFVVNFKNSLGLTGVFGSWAFMFIIIVLVALLFGTGMIAVQEPIAKKAIAVAWLLSSICIVGAFIFTGELGIWPILILVGGIVALIIMVLTVRLSGGTSING